MGAVSLRSAVACARREADSGELGSTREQDTRTAPSSTFDPEAPFSRIRNRLFASRAGDDASCCALARSVARSLARSTVVKHRPTRLPDAQSYFFASNFASNLSTASQYPISQKLPSTSKNLPTLQVSVVVGVVPSGLLSWMISVYSSSPAE